MLKLKHDFNVRGCMWNIINYFSARGCQSRDTSCTLSIAKTQSWNTLSFFLNRGFFPPFSVKWRWFCGQVSLSACGWVAERVFPHALKTHSARLRRQLSPRPHAPTHLSTNMHTQCQSIEQQQHNLRKSTVIRIRKENKVLKRVV